MAKWAVIIGAVLLVGVMVAAIVPMWVATAGMGMSSAGYSAVVLMIVFCFAVGGGLMFLIFYSARQGYDDAAYRRARGSPEPGESSFEARLQLAPKDEKSR
jgi:hypothetical protein